MNRERIGPKKEGILVNIERRGPRKEGMLVKRGRWGQRNERRNTCEEREVRTKCLKWEREGKKENNLLFVIEKFKLVLQGAKLL